MVKIQITQSFSGVVPPSNTPTGFRKGEIVEVPESVANEWKKIGYAVPLVESPLIEEDKADPVSSPAKKGKKTKETE